MCNCNIILMHFHELACYCLLAMAIVQVHRGSRQVVPKRENGKPGVNRSVPNPLETGGLTPDTHSGGDISWQRHFPSPVRRP